MNPIFIRLIIIAVALVIWFQTQKLIARKSGGMDGVGDWIHQLTAPWHRYFAENGKAANVALASSSFLIDVLGISLIAISVFGPDFTPFIAIMIVFILRQICQLCCTLPPPPGIIWRNPGVPTVLVTYDVGNDFFFSGHTALAVLGAIEICQIAPWWLGAITVLVALAEATIVLVLRAHYTLDVVTGAFAAWFAADMANRVSPWIDTWVK
ncbi:MAG: phosphatase PAP2-related protein [Verrucomicrobiota bacterium]